MQFFFNHSPVLAKTAPLDSRWGYAKAALTRNIIYIKRYYSQANQAVSGNHLLVNLINLLNVDQGLPLERYYNTVSAKTDKLSHLLKLTSSVEVGKLHPGVFYGPLVKEIIIADDSYTSPRYISENWQNYPSVKVIDHPVSNLDLLLPDGKKHSTAEGTATIVINIPALAIQFREFARINHIDLLAGKGADPITYFIHRFVLPNMLESHLDCCLVNRLYNHTVGAPMDEPIGKHPINLIDYTKHVEVVYTDLLKRLKRGIYDYWTMLRSIPLVSSPNMQEWARLPDLAPTRQIAWAEFITRIKTIEFMITAGSDTSIYVNAKDVNYLAKKLLTYSTDSVFRQITDNDVYLDTINRVNSIMQILNISGFKVK